MKKIIKWIENRRYKKLYLKVYFIYMERGQDPFNALKNTETDTNYIINKFKNL
jgi:hypothetical protein